ncbi:hypothetical protein [Ochrovirga pacifica]|uniref:hypothetical protein n=1 Tax=Ochrovirga pacifica TaxID=1042376 RepID=UPI0002D4BAD0|nr:hypothetical protein [Ochrovirga pacifica]
MKKILLVFAFALVGHVLHAQKIIKNPEFSATTATNVKIKKIELYDTITKIDFEVKYYPK